MRNSCPTATFPRRVTFGPAYRFLRLETEVRPEKFPEYTLGLPSCAPICVKLLKLPRNECVLNRQCEICATWQYPGYCRVRVELYPAPKLELLKKSTL